MNNIGEKYLPIGTVVLLKEATKRVMITGFASMSPETGNQIFDYSGCAYPEGFYSYNEVCVFNHDQIDKIFYMGYIDNEEVQFKQEFINKLNELLNNANNNNNGDN